MIEKGILTAIRTQIHSQFKKGWMVSEKAFIDSNLRCLELAFESYQIQNDLTYLNFMIETIDMVNEKLKGTIFTLGFFKARSHQMLALDEYARNASMMLEQNRPSPSHGSG